MQVSLPFSLGRTPLQAKVWLGHSVYLVITGAYVISVSLLVCALFLLQGLQVCTEQHTVCHTVRPFVSKLVMVLLGGTSFRTCGSAQHPSLVGGI